ncbi:hypothetical protein [Acidomonas methanolica]|uniref:Glycosyl transferase n=1 Tax=Acidomonas methanolica NBRC 104435 TaxID=1231351 RepID=A0A023D7V0_ACIMT|nr:hypothetical protein [Acidomonas methanolica]MBU2654383.1 hypothetical protein [Acidomonas methanolica]TCS28472.1 hypothetical protein EDC31_10861 [Acidomonas methanolica]GAJ30237.1 hypothetical protein Amme_113_009 [Acidomonas methanolica NBRC 104435]GBQ57944.1 hypothetical protein AA0498_2574 [Acidomonas methanolica]GEK99514.1 hypothetical protein AME01nite_20130 [Acidomonas methanolica NBRC 104435]
MPHIFIATPCYGGMVTQSYMQSVIGCLGEAGALGLTLTLGMIGDDALVTRARNTLLHQFFTRTDASHILFVDSDIGFTAHDIAALAASGKSVIGGAYPLKSQYWDAATTRLVAAGEAPATAGLRYVGECRALYDRPDAPLSRVSYVGTGFMLIARETVAALRAACPETRYRRIDAPGDRERMGGDAYALFDCAIDPDTGTYLSEDFAFCRRWTRIGGEVWLHRGLKLSHTGASTFLGDPAARRISPF